VIAATVAEETDYLPDIYITRSDPLSKLNVYIDLLRLILLNTISQRPKFRRTK